MSFTTSRFGVGDRSSCSGDGMPLDVRMIGERSTSIDGVFVEGGILTIGAPLKLGSSLSASFDRKSGSVLRPFAQCSVAPGPW